MLSVSHACACPVNPCSSSNGVRPLAAPVEDVEAQAVDGQEAIERAQEVHRDGLKRTWRGTRSGVRCRARPTLPRSRDRSWTAGRRPRCRTSPRSSRWVCRGSVTTVGTRRSGGAMRTARSAADLRLPSGHHRDGRRDLLAALLFEARLHTGARLQRLTLDLHRGRNHELGAVLQHDGVGGRIEALDLAL